MNFKKEYQQILLPLFKSSPVIIGLITIAMLVMRRAVTYMVPEYRASGAIKINNLSYSESAFHLFGKEQGTMPKQSENFLTEVEVFQTRDLIKKTLENLNWELTVYRVGKLHMVEIYEECPLLIEYRDVAPHRKNKFIYFDFLGDEVLRYRKGGEKDTVGVQFRLGQTLTDDGITFTVRPREEFLQKKPGSFQPGDRFAFKINTLESLADMCAGEKLFVKPVEKDISIIKIYFNHELPEKAQAFVNELMRTYIEEGRKSKQEQADQALRYLDQQLDEVTAKLQQAETQLAFYRSTNRLLNTTLETDATLKELSQLDMQKVDLEMKYSEMKRLQDYLLSGNDLSDFSPNFAALQDPIFRESYFKAQAYEGQLKDLLQKYTPRNPAVTNLNEKIKETRAFLYETVMTTIANLAVKRQEVEANIAKVSARIKKYPDKERRLVTLEREVSLNEGIYNFLMRKRTELAIGKTSDLYPHRIIEHAERPKSISSPNKSLLFGLAILMALLAGMVYAYLRSYFKDKVSAKEELEPLPAPLLGVVYRKPKKEKPGFSLVSGLVAALEKLPPPKINNQGQLLVISSMLPAEGKSFTAAELARGLVSSGKRVLVVDMDLRKPDLHNQLNVTSRFGYGDILEKRIYALDAIQKTDCPHLYILTSGELRSANYALLFSRRSLDVIYDLRWHFDVVIVDTPPLGVFEDALPLMNESTANLFLLRAGFTRRRMLGAITTLLTETQIPNLFLVLNAVNDTSKVPGYREYLKKYYDREFSPPTGEWAVACGGGNGANHADPAYRKWRWIEMVKNSIW